MLSGEIKPWGNSFGVHIPKREARRLGLRPGDRVVIARPESDIDAFGICRGARPFTRDHRDDLRF